MVTTREKILFEGTDDHARLWELHRYVALDHPASSLEDVQSQVLALLRSMVEQGEIALGDPTENGFAEWEVPLDDAIAYLAEFYVERFDHRDEWQWQIWLLVTEKGRDIGYRCADEYAVWLADLRARDMEYELVAQHLDPDPARLAP